MKAVQLGVAGELGRVPDAIEIAQSLQSQIAMTPPEKQIEIATEGIDSLLSDARSIHGARHLAVHTMLALVQRDYHETCSDDEEIYDGLRLTNVWLRGEFSRFAFLKSPLITTLTMQMFEVDISGATEEGFAGQRILSGMHVPVMAVESVLPLR